MRIAVVLGFLLLVGSAAGGSDVSRYQVQRGSQLEKELGYEVSVQDKHDEWQSDSRDGIGIEGPAPEYVVKFHATAGGKLKDLFELDLALTDANGTLLHVPVSDQIEIQQGESSRRSVPHQEGRDQSGGVHHSLWRPATRRS